MCRTPSAVRRLLFGLIVLAGGLSQVGSITAAERPNFVFIYTDDQRWDALGVVQREQGEKARFPWIESPNLDRLAAQGIRFRNAFVVTSLCAPSRAAFLTGRYGHLNGVVNNHTPFPEQSVTHASVLRTAGYRTGYVGKWHMGSQSGQRPGFDFSASFIGQGVFFDCPIEVNGVKTPSTGWVDDVSTSYAIQFIKENKDRPFSLVLGFKTCHGPFTPPPRTADLYADAEARSVPNLDVPAVYKDDESAKGRKQAAPKTPTNHGMFRGLRAVDENVGKLMATLDELGLAENTVIVYSSDNGYYLGEHGLGDKRTAYDEALRIPLLMRYPKLGLRGVTIDRMVLNIDLAPTLIDFAGVAVPAQMQGRSWRPLLNSSAEQAPWRTSYFYSYFREGRSAAPTVTAVRTETAKLIRYPGHDDWTEMFDLQADPYETKNLFGDSAHADLRKTLEAEYEKQSAAAEYRVPDFADEKTLPAEPKPLNEWVLDYRFDQAEGAKIVDASGHQNAGDAENTKRVEGGLRFDGRGHVHVKKSASLDPSVGPWTIEATFQSDGPEGIVLARGGQTNGYALYLVDGRPTFVYTTPEGRRMLAAKNSVQGKRTTVRVVLSDDKRAAMLIDGREVVQGRIPQWIARDPNDEMQIGDDRNSPVLEQEIKPFQGVIFRVRLGSGAPPN